MLRTSSQPGLAVSTRNQHTPSGARATTIAKAASTAPDANHLCPSSTQPSPSRRAVVRIMRGSEPTPGAGSVMAKVERISPRSSGASQRSRCAGEARCSRVSMLGWSGAAQPIAPGPSRLRPACSKTRAHSRQDRPMPPCSGASCGDTSPRASACWRNSRVTRSRPATSWARVRSSRGMTTSSMNWRTFRHRASSSVGDRVVRRVLSE